MRFIVRPYNADFGLLAGAMADGLRPDGIMVDANIIRRYNRAFDSDLRPLVNGQMDLIFDNNLERSRRPNFTAKPTYAALPYVTGGILSLASISADASGLAQQIFDLQDQHNPTLYTSPYLYLSAESLEAGSVERVNAQTALIDAFAAIAPADRTLLSLAVSAPALRDAAVRARVITLANRVRSAGLYLLLFGMDITKDAEMGGTAAFLAGLRETHNRIVLSHAPFFVYCLEPYGVTDFVSGINFMTTLTEEYLTRAAEIGGIAHNYYLRERLMKATPQNALDLIDRGLIERCTCPACVDAEGGVPFDQTRIRQHYLFARSQEAADVNANGAATVRTYLDQAEELIAGAADEEIALVSPPLTEHWRRLLNGF